jgi:hypothetical protein
MPVYAWLNEMGLWPKFGLYWGMVIVVIVLA